MTDIRAIAASFRTVSAHGANVLAIAASLPLPSVQACAALGRPFSLAAKAAALSNPLAGRVFVPGFIQAKD